MGNVQRFRNIGRWTRVSRIESTRTHEDARASRRRGWNSSFPPRMAFLKPLCHLLPRAIEPRCYLSIPLARSIASKYLAEPCRGNENGSEVSLHLLNLRCEILLRNLGRLFREFYKSVS